jgi:serine phosphatase RsbU (regulator of sigma subunit)
VLGVFPDATFGETELTLGASGDTLVLLTDGILEARSEDGHRPGIAAVLPALEREAGTGAQALAERLSADVLHRGGSRVQDDMTVFVLRRP